MLFHYISHHGKATSFLMCASGFMVFLVYFNYNLMLYLYNCNKQEEHT